MKTNRIYTLFIALFFSIGSFGQNFNDDLSKEEINQAPSKWNVLKGKAKVTSVDGKKIIEIVDHTTISPKVAGASTMYLGDEFTLEFDLLFDKDGSSYSQFYKLRLWEGIGNYRVKDSYTDPLLIYRHGVRAAGTYTSDLRSKELQVLDHKVWRHIKVVYKNDGLDIYINDLLLYSNPTLFYKPNMISLGLRLHSNGVFLKSGLTNIELSDTAANQPEITQLNFNRKIDNKAHDMLKKLLPKGIQSFSFAPNGGWVIITKTNEHFAQNIPGDCYEKIKEFVQNGTKIKEVVFPPNGGANSWLIITENQTFARNIPDECYNKLTELQNSGKKIKSVSFPYKNIFNSSNEAWSIITADGNFYVKNIPDECYQIMRNISQSDMPNKAAVRKIYKVVYTPSGGWTVLAEDYFFSRNIPEEAFKKLGEFRGKGYNNTIVAFDPDKNGWSIVADKRIVTAPTDLIRGFENIVNGTSIWQNLRDNKVPGAAVAVVINGKIAWQTAYGHLIKNDKRKASHPESMFQAASISKVFAAVGALNLVDQGTISLDENLMNTGKLQWDVPFHDCIKDSSWVDSFKRLTVRNILNHTSGIHGRASEFNSNCIYKPRNVFGNFPGGGYLGDTDEIRSLKDLMEEITITYDPTVTPTPNNQSIWYSGMAFTVLQKLMKDVTGERFPFWMRDNILRPIDMNESEFTVYPERHYNLHNLARAHDNTGRTYEIQRYPQYAAAGLYTNAGELANFLIMLNNDGAFQGKRILNETTSKLLTNGTGTFTSDGNITTASSPKMYEHGGSNTGFRTYMIGFPRIIGDPNGISSAGIVVLTNGGVRKVRYDIANAIIKAYGW